MNCKYRTAATLYILETHCCRYIIVNILYESDDDDKKNNNNKYVGLKICRI
jgi:hypothetical protein